MCATLFALHAIKPTISYKRHNNTKILDLTDRRHIYDHSVKTVKCIFR